MVNKNNIQREIAAMMARMQTQSSGDEAVAYFAEELANIIHKAILSAETEIKILKKALEIDVKTSVAPVGTMTNVDTLTIKGTLN